MKKSILILAVSLMMPFIGAAQDLTKYENMKDVTSMVMTSKMFKLLSNIDFSSEDKEVQAYSDLIEDLENIMVFVSEKPEIRKQMAADVQQYLKNSKLDELMRVTDDGKTVKFYSKPGRNSEYVSELFMFLESTDKEEPATVILRITGDINLKDVSKLTQDLKVPGAEELKNIETKK
ncbi:MAG TPA: DUF4252 domain-containing protein [Salinimicrobium sp.]|nr:DUF4252 domain-containing protein [Salinimicrobium sp.]